MGSLKIISIDKEYLRSFKPSNIYIYISHLRRVATPIDSSGKLIPS